MRQRNSALVVKKIMDNMSEHACWHDNISANSLLRKHNIRSDKIKQQHAFQYYNLQNGRY